MQSVSIVYTKITSGCNKNIHAELQFISYDISKNGKYFQFWRFRGSYLLQETELITILMYFDVQKMLKPFTLLNPWNKWLISPVALFKKTQFFSIFSTKENLTAMD